MSSSKEIVNSSIETQASLPTKKRRKLPIKKVIPDKQDLAFTPKPIINCSIPQMQPKNPDGSFVTHWERKNGNATLTLTASPKYGLPAGKDRLFMIWLKTKAVMSGSPIVYFKDGASILEEMGLDPKGNNKIWLNEVINRCHFTTAHYVEGNKFRGGYSEGAPIIKKMCGYFDEKELETGERPHFVLGEVFDRFTGIPADLNLIRKLGRAYFTIDLYSFIVFRLWSETRNAQIEDDLSKRSPLRIPMREYRQQSGAPLTLEDKTFRQDLKKAFKKIAETSGIKMSLDKNDVITVPIVRPRRIYAPKFQEGIESFHNALGVNPVVDPTAL